MIEAKSANPASFLSSTAVKVVGDDQLTILLPDGSELKLSKPLSVPVPQKPRGITMTMELVTPDIAQAWLDESKENRPKSQKAVDVLAEKMSKGKYVINGQTVSFDTDEKLHDGQHRLHAIIKSNTAQWLIIVRGIEHATFTTVDIGRKRSTNDVFAIEGSKYYQTTSAASRLLMVYRDRSHGLKFAIPSHYDNETALAYWQENPQLEHVASHVEPKKHTLWARVPKSTTTAFYVLALRAGWGEEKIDFFLRKVSRGEELANGDPILTLRNHLIKMERKESQTKNVSLQEKSLDVLVRLIRTFNLHVQDKQSATIYGFRTTTGDTYPAILRQKEI